MSKKLPKRYVNEKAVKRALGIDSFRNVSKDKIMEFASLIPYMDKDVAIAIINQFPVYADFGKATIEQYTQACSNILEKNKERDSKMISWNFPGNQDGQVKGVADAGIENFNGTELSSLARENCQNSLDAALNDSNPDVRL